MADAAERVLKILLRLSADTAAKGPVISSLKEVEAQAAKTNATISGGAGLTGATSERDVKLQEMALAIKKQHGVTDEFALKIAGRRLAAEEAILAVQAKAAEVVKGGAAAAPDAGTATAGAGLGIGNALFIGVAAGYQLYQTLTAIADESTRLALETRKETDELVKQLTLWNELAHAASNFSDVLKFGEKIETGLDKAAAKLEEFRNKQLTLMEVLIDQIAREFSTIPGHGPQPFADKQAKGIASRESELESLLREGVGFRGAAEQAAAAWQSLKLEPLNDAIAKQNTLVAEAREKYAALKKEMSGLATGKLDEDKARQAITTFRALGEAGRNLEQLTERSNELTKAEATLAAQSDKVAESISKIGLGKAEELATQLEEIHAKLKEQGVDAASPHEALEKSKTLTAEVAAIVVGLAGKWAGVLANVEDVDRQLQKMVDHEAVIRAHAFGTPDEIVNAEWGARYNSILEQRKNLDGDLSADSINQAVYAEIIAKERDKERSAAERSAGVNHELLDMKREESALMKDIRQQQQLIEANPNLSPDEKVAAMVPLLQKEQQELLKTIEVWQMYLAAQKGADPQTISNMTEAIGKLRELQSEYQMLGFKVQSISGGVTGELRRWANSFGTSSEQIGKTIETNINGAIRATSQLLTDALFRTGNWKQALIGVGEAGVQSLIEMGLQMLITHTLGETLKATATSTQVAQAGVKLSAEAPVAAATSISSYGWAAIIGAALAVAAIGFIIGSLSGGMAGGGRVPGRPSRRDNLLLPMATGEQVINATATEWADRTFGDDFLSDINQMRIPVSAGLAAGGRVGGGGASPGRGAIPGAGAQVHIAIFDDPKKLGKWLESREGQKIIYDTVNRRRTELGI